MCTRHGSLMPPIGPLVSADAKASDTDFLMYSTTYCPYCVGAKRYLLGRDLTFTEENLQAQPDRLRAIQSETGHRTVPIMIDLRSGTPAFVGGFDDLQDWLD